MITNRPVSIGDELTDNCCDISDIFEDKCKNFKKWNAGDGFKCLCEKCVYQRENPSIVAVDVEIENTHTRAIELNGRGQTLSSDHRKAIIKILEEQPLIG